MSKLVLPLFLCFLTFVCSQDPNVDAVKNVFGDQFRWIPPGFEVISTTPLPSIGALERCGEGKQKGLKVCVPYHRCDEATNTIIAEPVNTDGAGIIDIRAGVNECESYMDVCCQLPASGEIPTPAPTEKPPTPPVPPTPKPSFCGIRNANGLDFTITGNTNGESQYGEFPWVLALLKANYNPSVDESLAICGASLIAPQVALTGAHCVAQYQKNLGDIKVRAGEWDTFSEKERYPYQERAVKQIIVHKDYNPKSLANDYGLVILDRPYTQAINIGTICLPPQGIVFDSSNCFVMGWGKKQFGSKASYSNILKKIELPIVNHGQCQSELKTSRLGAHFNLHGNFICAGAKGKDACTGDGGSPLICPDPNNPSRYQQVGIVAWGIGCGDYPGVYADVTKGRQWIDDNMAALGFDQKPYTV